MEQQHFVEKPLRDKAAATVPGIEEPFAERLREAGIKYAYQLLGKFLRLEKDEAKFKSWLRYKCGEGFGKNRQDQVYQCYKEWSDRHIK
ncbi:hypothetical protein BaRGS_00006027 [Batillaria attramentaria]|uniref:Barrier-to-autointegration factor n=1 Tax=Batillaria attramentaria TaxID=370345 RepID=A0ABD0LU11_9CAEN|nr:hypothetical protein BaRGS_035052 [Batillaria attramentaria]